MWYSKLKIELISLGPLKNNLFLMEIEKLSLSNFTFSLQQ